MTAIRNLTDDSIARRLTDALLAGQAAYDQEHISEPAFRFYRYIVTFIIKSGNDQIHAGVDYLAGHWHTTVRTVSRWFHQLVNAGLLGRKYRPNKEALTYLPSMSDPRSDPRSDRMSDPPLTRENLIVEPLAEAKGRRPVLHFDSQTINATIASATHSEVEVPVTPATKVLRAAGVQSPAALRELADKPVEEVRAVIDDVEHRSNVRSIPGLLVKVLKDGLWSKGRRKGAAKELTVADYTGYCEVCMGYPCKCEDAPEPPPDQEATVDPQLAGYLAGYCEACCGMTYGNCPCWTGPEGGE